MCLLKKEISCPKLTLTVYLNSLWVSLLQGQSSAKQNGILLFNLLFNFNTYYLILILTI